MSDCSGCGSNMDYQKIVPYKEWKKALKDYNDVLSLEKKGCSERIRELTSKISAEQDHIAKKAIRRELREYKEKLADVQSTISRNDDSLNLGSLSKDGTIFMMDGFGSFRRWLMGDTLKKRFETTYEENKKAYS